MIGHRDKFARSAFILVLVSTGCNPASDAQPAPAAELSSTVPAAARAEPPSAAIQAAITELDALVTAGELDQALALARQWTEREPNVAELHFALGLITRSKLSLTAAEPAFERALELQPTHTTWMVRIAAGYLEVGDEDGAEVYLRRALHADPYKGDAAAMLSGVLIARGENEAALQILEPAQASGRPDVFRELGRAYRAVGRDEDAERNLRRAVDLDPRDLQALLNLGQLLQRTGRAAEGTAFLERMAEISTETDALDFIEGSSRVDGATVTNFLAVGEARRMQGDLAGAAAAYRQAAARDPGNATPHVGLATVALTQRDFAATLKHAQQAVDLAPDHAQAHLLVGLSLVRLGQSGAATTYLERSRQLEPWQAIQWDMTALAFVDAGQLNEAAKAYAQANALDPMNEPLALRLGLTHLLRGDLMSARESLASSTASMPTSGDLALAYSLVLDRLGDPDREAAFQAAADRYSASGTDLAVAAARFSQYPGTLDALERFKSLADRP